MTFDVEGIQVRNEVSRLSTTLVDYNSLAYSGQTMIIVRVTAKTIPSTTACM